MKKLPTTRAGINALIHKMRRHPEYHERIPPDSRLANSRFSNFCPSIRLPRQVDLHHRVLVEGQAPDGIVWNEDGEFSGRGMTQWYVESFCALNHLKV